MAIFDIFKGREMIRREASLVANNITYRLIMKKKSLKDFLVEFEIFLETEIQFVYPNCSISAEQSREIGKLVTYLYSEWKEAIEEIIKFEEKIKPILKRQKEQGVLHEGYRLDAIERKIDLMSKLPLHVLESIDNGTNDNMFKDVSMNLDNHTKIIVVSKNKLDELLPSFKLN